MNWKHRVVVLFAIAALVAGCSSKPTETTEPQQPNPNEKPNLTKKDLKEKQPPNKGVGPKTKDPAITPATLIPTGDLTSEFKTNRDEATTKYVGKTFTVQGKLKDIKVVGKDIQIVFEDSGSDGSPQIAATMKSYIKMAPFSYSRGVKLKVQGQCSGATAETISLTDCVFTGSDPDTTPQMSIRDLLAAYSTDAAGDVKYKGKLIRVDTAEVESSPQDGTLYLLPFSRIPGSKPPAKKIRVEYNASYKPLFPQLKPGVSNVVYGRCEGAVGNEIVIKDAWFMHLATLP
jgi:hypothetical protein